MASTRKKTSLAYLLMALLAVGFAAEQLISSHYLEQSTFDYPLTSVHLALSDWDAHPLVIGFDALPKHAPSTSNDYAVRITRPASVALESSRFRVDVLVAGVQRPDSVELLLAGKSIAQVDIRPQDWKAPGSATVTNILVNGGALAGRWSNLIARAKFKGVTVAQSKSISLWLVKSKKRLVATPNQINALKIAFRQTAADLTITVDRESRKHPQTWPFSAPYRRIRTKLISQLPHGGVRRVMKALLGALESQNAMLTRVAADLLNATMASHELPFFVHVYMKGGAAAVRFLLFSYRLRAIATIRIGGEKIVIQRATRLDSINRRRRLLGHQSSGVAQAIILRRQIRRFRDRWLNCLKDTDSCASKRRQTRKHIDLGTLQRAFNKAKTELNSLVGFKCQAAPIQYATKLTPHLWLMVGHHEARHVYDHRVGLPLSRTIRQMLKQRLDTYRLRNPSDIGARLTLEHSAYRTVAFANLEVSAYLAELIEVDGTRFINLDRLHYFATNGGVGGPTYWAARAILCGLGRQLKLANGDLCLSGRQADGWRYVYLALLKLSPAQLRLAAQTLYRGEFGRYVPAILMQKVGL